ncbi:MAG: DUF202 domain-containing protein [Zavarzinella sp.]
MNETQLRDELAVERTKLANERTVLAYIRTALALAGGGAVLLQLYPSNNLILILAWTLIIFGMLVVVIGAYRFVAIRNRLRKQK